MAGNPQGDPDAGVGPDLDLPLPPGLNASTTPAISERNAWSINGFLGLFAGLIALLVGGFLGLGGIGNDSGALTLVGVVIVIIALIFLGATTVIQPGETKVVQFFGRYVGTIRRTGLVMTVPFTTRRRVSVRVQNFETHELKVNDADGNPINIAGVIVWQVADTAKASFAVENYQHFIGVQAESALRHVATSHPYDSRDTHETSLRGSTDQVSAEIATEVAARAQLAGLEIVEARISNLAYAPEIAQAMLQRQQASAIVAAREQIVEGAVSMVEGALRRLEANDTVRMDDDRRAAMVSNLLVVLCGESRATPVVNTSSMPG